MFNYRVFKNAILNLWRNKWLTFATVTIMTLALLVVGLFVVVNLFVSSTADEVKANIDLEVFFKEDVSENEILAVKNDISRLDQVEGVTYISKKDALAIFRNQNPNDPDIANIITEEDNPLPASIKISFHEAESLSGVNDLFMKGKYLELVEKTTYQDDRNRLAVDRIIAVSNFVKKWGGILSVIFLLITLIVVFNTISVTIYTRREEIEIMRLVGATNWYIRWPFILEGVCYGLIAAIFALLFILVGLSWLEPKLTPFFGEAAINFYGDYRAYRLEIIGVQVLVSVFVGVVSSLMAIGKYLRR